MSGPLGPAKPRWTGPELKVCDGSWCVVIELHSADPEAEAEAVLKRLRWDSAFLWIEQGTAKPVKTWGRPTRWKF